MVLKQFQEKFKVNDYKMYETDYWIWSLRPHQATLGAGILSLKRECASFSELKKEEYEDLNNIIKIIEPTLKKTFDYDVMNYLMLMMDDKHVHYHVVPRYEHSFEFNNESWEDAGWPTLPKLAGDASDSNTLEVITETIKENIKR